MRKRIPENGKFIQTNKGDTYGPIGGNVYRTTNIDLKTNPGLLRLSPRMTINTKDNDTGISGMGIPHGFVTHMPSNPAKFYTACGIGAQNAVGTGKILVSSTADLTSTFTVDATGPTNIHYHYSDIVEWNKGLYVTTFGATPNIAQFSSSWDTSWWSSTVSGSNFGTTTGLKNMCPAFNGNLYVIDDSKIKYVPTSGNAVTSGTGTIDFGNAYRPIWIRSSSNRIWIGLMTKDASTGGTGYVAEWDGTGTAVNRLYKIDAPCALSCVIKDDIPYIIDAYGILKKYNNSGFVEVARLPVANLRVEMPGIYDDLTNVRWVHHRGMDLVDGEINILVNNVDSSGNYVKEMPSGLWEYIEGQGLRHKASPCTSVSDWGQQAIAAAGAIMGTKKSTGTYLAGLSYYTDDATTQRYGIFYDDVTNNSNKRGILETPFLTVDRIEDTFGELSYRFRPFTVGDFIKPKYRVMKDAHLPFIASITWTAANRFTSTDTNFQYVSADNEAEIVMGTGGSATSRITSISANAGTYTVNLEDSIGPTSGTGKAMITNYISIPAFSDTNRSSETTNLGPVGTKVQIKTEFVGTGDFEIDDITIGSQNHK